MRLYLYRFSNSCGELHHCIAFGLLVLYTSFSRLLEYISGISPGQALILSSMSSAHNGGNGSKTATGHSVKHRLKYTGVLTTLLLQVLLLSGDVQLNPGPIRYPCGVEACGKPVKSNQKGIQCDGCFSWFHTKCIKFENFEIAST